MVTMGLKVLCKFCAIHSPIVLPVPMKRSPPAASARILAGGVDAADSEMVKQNSPHVTKRQGIPLS